MNNKKTNAVKDFLILYEKLSKDKKSLFFRLFLLMLVGGLAEVVSLGMVFPFLAVLIDPQQALDIPFISWTLGLFNSSLDKSIYQVALLFLVIIVVANTIRFLLITTAVKFNFEAGHELSVEIYKNALYRTYTKQLNSNSSEIVGGLNKLENLVWIILSVINFISGIVMIIFIITALAFINPKLTFLILFGLSSIYAIFSVISRNKLSLSSQAISVNGNKRIQSVQEGLSSIRDILLNHDQQVFIDRFSKIDWNMRSAQISTNIIAPTPRFVVESLSMIFIVSFAYVSVINSDNATYVVPILGVLVMSLQRLIPLAQQVYFGWSQFNGNRGILHDVALLVNQNTYQYSKAIVGGIDFQDYIKFKDVSFRYKPTSPLVVDKINFEIAKGSKVGFIGGTGSGKSTIVDLLLSLVRPVDGEILIDGIGLSEENHFEWQKHVAHVPQSVYLLDGSFEENIAFGVDSKNIDIDLVKRSAEKAKISKFIDSCSDGYNTKIGESGSLLSGGQIQRIGIARALYKRASVLIFDEATSALDGTTEKEVIDEISNLGEDVTIIIVTHNLSTLKNSDWVYKLDQGVIIKEGPPKSMLNEKLS